MHGTIPIRLLQSSTSAFPPQSNVLPDTGASRDGAEGASPVQDSLIQLTDHTYRASKKLQSASPPAACAAGAGPGQPRCSAGSAVASSTPAFRSCQGWATVLSLGGEGEASALSHREVITVQ